MKRILIFLVTIAVLSSCGLTSGLTRGTQYPLMYKEKPVTLLIMPPINNTTNVEAKDLLYTSISKPLIDAGYYVIPPMIAMEILKEESAYDSEIFVDSSLEMFKTFFGADAVVFSEINKWAKSGSVSMPISVISYVPQLPGRFFSTEVATSFSTYLRNLIQMKTRIHPSCLYSSI